MDKNEKAHTIAMVKKIHNYYKEGFYYCNGYDLTASRQRRLEFEQKLEDENIQAKPIEFLACDSRYFWNKNNY